VATNYTYDFENQLTKVEYPGTVALYKYDPFGRRIEKNVNGEITWYVYDGANIVTEYDGNGEVRNAYIHNLAIDDPLAVQQGTNTFYYHKDGLGSVTNLTDGTGSAVNSYTYKSFGEIYSQTGSLVQPYTFTGREYDPESGLYYYRARYYDPRAGRFLTRDPIGFAGGDANLYRYVKNNPINLIDPEGLLGKSCSQEGYETCESTRWYFGGFRGNCQRGGYSGPELEQLVSECKAQTDLVCKCICEGKETKTSLRNKIENRCPPRNMNCRQFLDCAQKVISENCRTTK
jgi:RHS repeat-associated protein